MRRDVDYVADIANAVRRISSYVRGLDRETFGERPIVQDAVIRQLLIIGEATKQLTPEFRAAHADVPWRDMAAMRDILVHAYSRVDIDEVWRAATADVAKLADRLEALLPPPPG